MGAWATATKNLAILEDVELVKVLGDSRLKLRELIAYTEMESYPDLFKSGEDKTMVIQPDPFENLVPVPDGVGPLALQDHATRVKDSIDAVVIEARASLNVVAAFLEDAFSKATNAVEGMCPEWNKTMNLLEDPIKSKLTCNPNFAELGSAAAKLMTHAEQIKKIHADGCGLLISPEVWRKSNDVAAHAIQTVGVTYAVFTLVGPIAGLKTAEEQGKAAEDLKEALEQRQIEIADCLEVATAPALALAAAAAATAAIASAAASTATYYY